MITELVEPCVKKLNQRNYIPQCGLHTSIKSPLLRLPHRLTDRLHLHLSIDRFYIKGSKVLFTRGERLLSRASGPRH